jgi:cell division protein YceG involved in septum cleavage
MPPSPIEITQEPMPLSDATPSPETLVGLPVSASPERPLPSEAPSPPIEPTRDPERSPPITPDPASEPLPPQTRLPPPTPPPPLAPATRLGLSERPVAAAPPRRGRRSLLARLAAALALAAVVAAVVLVLHSRESKPVATVSAPPVVKVLIPEGKTRAQIAQIASADRLKGSYRVASRHSPLLNPASYGAPRSTPDLEGFLFPATYDMNPGELVNRLVEEQLIAFRENFGPSEIARAKTLHVTPYQLLIVASMVEREAQIPGDRPKIAAVIYNRLAHGMPLGIDASIYYAVELATGVATYTRELTEAQLHINSPYNTRTHVGLPPTPISNPGAASIHAAAYPAHVSYLYYVAGADGCGEQVFSNTLAEFEANAAAYKAAVARAGGHPPSCKHPLTGTGK